MSDKPKKTRGKGIKPAMTYRALRIPVAVLKYYEDNFSNPSKKMREALEKYMQEELNNNGDNTRKESEGQSSQDSEGV